MAGKITDYPTMTTLASGDLMDVSDSDGVGGFTSKSLDWDDLKTNIEGQITFANIYSNNGTLAGNRVVTLNGNDLTFAGTVDANLLRLDPTTDFIGIGTILPSAKLEVVGNTKISGNITQTDSSAETSLANGDIYIDSVAAAGIPAIWLDQTGAKTLTNASFWQTGTLQGHGVATGGQFQFRINDQASQGMTLKEPNGNVHAAYLSVGNTSLTNKYISLGGGQYGLGIRSGALGINTLSTGKIFFSGYDGSTTPTDLMVIEAATGNVGIGTATPTETLEVAGNGYINGRLGVNAAPFGNAASYLISISGDLYGKRIIADNLAANGFGLYVRSTSPTNNFGIYGKSTTTGSGVESSGVEGISDGTNGTNHYGVRGRGKNGSSLSFGGYFQIEGGATIVAANRTSAVYGLNQSTNSGQNIAIQGISLSTSGISYGLKAEATGAATTNYGGYFRATGATNNYAIIVPSGGGNVGIGTTTPDANAKLDVDGVIKTKSYVVASLPTVVVGGIIYVSDETGGAVLAFSDGVDWRRVTDRAIVS